MWIIEFEKGHFLNWEDRPELLTTLRPEAKEFQSMQAAQERADEINEDIDNEDHHCKVRPLHDDNDDDDDEF